MNSLADFVRFELQDGIRVIAHRSEAPMLDIVRLKISLFMPRKSAARLVDHRFEIVNEDNTSSIDCILESVDRGVNNQKPGWKSQPLVLFPLVLCGDRGGIETMYRFHLRTAFNSNTKKLQLSLPEIIIKSFVYCITPIEFHYQTDRNSYGLLQPPNPSFQRTASGGR